MAKKKHASAFVRTFLSLFGKSETHEDKNQLKDNFLHEQKNTYVQFNEQELRNIIGGSSAKSEDQQMQEVRNKIQSMVANLMPTSDKISKQATQNQMLTYMAPEILQAKRIYTSSIMSPNDMQTGHISVVVDSDEIEDEMAAKINRVLTDFFNDELSLGNKMTDWIGECLFNSGAKPVLILPGDYDPKKNMGEASLESLDSRIEIQLDDQAELEAIDTLRENDFPYIGNDSDANKVVQATQKALANINKYYGATVPTNSSFVSADPGEIRSGRSTLKKKAKQVNENYIKSQYGALFIAEDEERMDDTEPVFVELPTHAVVPVHMPGHPDEHIGYFVMVDKWGDPMIFDPSQVHDSMLSTDSNIKKAYQSATGDDGHTQTFWGHKLDDSEKWKAMTTVFNLSIRKTLEAHLNKQNLNDMSFNLSNTVSNFILYNMLKRSKVKLVFVPESLMCYYAFDYRVDGTGKSLIEDIEGPLTLRTTLYIAHVMASIDKAVQQTTITVDVDKKETNVEQMLNTLENVFVSKHRLNFNNLSPSTISDSIARNSLRIVPKGIPGLENVDVEKSSDNRQGAEVDDRMIEDLTNLCITGLGIPHSAVNELGDTEYSRTVATMNLMFCNIIREMQASLKPANTKMVRKYTILSKKLRDKLEKAIYGYEERDKSEEGEDDKKSDSKTKKSESEQPKDQEYVTNLIRAVVKTVTVNLPAPNISVSKSQFEEIDSYIRSIQEVMEKLIPSNLVMQDDSQKREQLESIRAFATSKMLHKFISGMASDNMSFPSISEFLEEDGSEMSEIQSKLRNYFKKIDDAATAMGGGEEEGGGGW